MRFGSGMPAKFPVIRCVVILCCQQRDPILDIYCKQRLKPKSAPFVCKIPPQACSMRWSWMHHYSAHNKEPSDNGGWKEKSSVILSVFQKPYEICWACRGEIQFMVLLSSSRIRNDFLWFHTVKQTEDTPGKTPHSNIYSLIHTVITLTDCWWGFMIATMYCFSKAIV